MSRRIFKMVLATVAVGAAVAGALLAPGCQTFQMEDQEIEGRFAGKGLGSPTTYEADANPGTIFLAKTAGPSAEAPAVVFIHGSPGSWDNYLNYFLDTDLRARATLVALDRPGFGRSRPRRAVASLEEQARQLSEALGQVGIEKDAVLVGHSLGGPVVARMAVDYPGLVGGLVLVAPSLDPDLEKRKWYNYAAKFPLVRWALPKDWEVSNEEIFPHKKELLALEKRLEEITVPTIVIQGMEDELVPAGNADYAEKMLSGVDALQVWRIDGLNHFVPWSRPDLLKKAALELAAEPWEE